MKFLQWFKFSTWTAKCHSWLLHVDKWRSEVRSILCLRFVEEILCVWRL